MNEFLANISIDQLQPLNFSVTFSVTFITEIIENLVLSKLDLFQEIEQHNRPVGDDIPKEI